MCECVCFGGVDGVVAVSNTVQCWQTSSEVIRYSDRAACIFSWRERTNNEAGKVEGDNKEGEEWGGKREEGSEKDKEQWEE